MEQVHKLQESEAQLQNRAAEANQEIRKISELNKKQQLEYQKALQSVRKKEKEIREKEEEI